MMKKYYLFNEEERRTVRPRGSKLNVLFNLDPYLARVRRGTASRLNIASRLLDALEKSEYFDLDYRVLGANSFIKEIEKYPKLQREFVTLTQKQLLECFGYSSITAYREVFLNSPEETPGKLAQSCQRALGHFVPDIIIAFGTANYLKHIYPKSAIIHFDSGFISRAPYPKFMWLDPLGQHGEGVVGKHWDAIMSSNYCEEEITYANWVWKEVFLARQQIQNPMNDFLSGLRDPDKKLFLIATQFVETYNFYGCCDYDDDIHFVNDCMAQLPDDCQVIITMHPWNEQKLRTHVTDLALEDARIIDDDRVYDVPMTSQSVMPYCDGVICIASGVGIQAKLWGVPLACPGESYLTRMCDTTDISKLGELDSSPESRKARRDEIAPYMYFAAARQSVHEADWYDPDGLVDIVLNWLDCASRNVHPLAYFDRLGKRDFQREKETVISHLVDLTPQNLESWRFSEKGLPLLRKVTPSRRLVNRVRRLASKLKKASGRVSRPLGVSYWRGKRKLHE